MLIYFTLTLRLIFYILTNLEERMIDGNVDSSISETDAYQDKYIFDDVEITNTSLEDMNIDLLLEYAMVVAIHSSPHKGRKA